MKNPHIWNVGVFLAVKILLFMVIYGKEEQRGEIYAYIIHGGSSSSWFDFLLMLLKKR